MKDLKDMRILVVGDTILDEYVDGNVSRVSPEAPIVILDKMRGYYRLGGASNVSLNVASLGITVHHLSQIGLDIPGDVVKKQLKEAKIVTDHLLRTSERPTILKTRFTCGNIQLLRVDYEDKSSIEGSATATQVEAFLRTYLREFDAVIVSDYQKGFVYPALAELIGRLSATYNIPVICDTHKKDWSCFKDYTCITPNKKELEQAVGRKLSTLYEIEAAGMQVRRDLNLQYLLITLSENGMMLITQYASEYVPVEPVKVVDVTGCGDTAIAVFTAMLASGRPPLIATKLANHAAGIVCEKMGTATISLEELS